MQLTARVAVSGAVYHFDRLYSYLVPPRLPELRPGCRVKVAFGRGNKPTAAIVLSLEHTEETEHLKQILEQLDDEPILNEEGLKLLAYLKEQTFCTWFDALRLLIPAGLGVIFRTSYAAVSDAPEPGDPAAREIFAYLQKRKAPVPLDALAERFENAEPLLEPMAHDGQVERLEQSRNQILDDKVTMVRLCDGWEAKRLTPQQKQVLDFLTEHESVSLKELCYYTGVTRVVAQGLQKKGAVEFYDTVAYRNPYKGVSAGAGSAIELSQEQKNAYDQLSDCLESPERPALLYGVTGSGKTQVYLSLIQKALDMGKSVIVLVPEIALTSQTLESFHDRFGGRVAVLHSGLSLGERMDEWRRIKEGGADIVVGTRSAVFAPVQNLGLLVIDEEQEHTYKSDKSPRFHARDVAKLRCRHHGALLLLASATPSVESYHAATSGRYHLVELPGRFGSNDLPEVAVIHMGEAENLSDTPSLSLPLREELYYNLSCGQQSILLLNRRGHSTLIRCSACGEAAECPNCSVALTYHAANDALLCHYCGYQTGRQKQCKACGSELVRYSGLGTQKLEEELNAVFPEARILRVDMDTTMGKFSHKKLFDAFAAGEYDIMLGTQMVAKGLNFPKVTLVGVLNTDQSLYANDFRSFERSFSLLTQVVGRCGRGELGGRALIQTYSPESPIIRLAARQDYPAFFEEEIQSRKIHLYPPYCAMVGIGFTGTALAMVRSAANDFLRQFRELASVRYPALPLRVLGPTPSDVAKAAGKYRYKLILKCRNDGETREMLASMLQWYYQNVKQVSIFIDMYYDGF